MKLAYNSWLILFSHLHISITGMINQPSTHIDPTQLLGTSAPQFVDFYPWVPAVHNVRLWCLEQVQTDITIGPKIPIAASVSTCTGWFAEMGPAPWHPSACKWQEEMACITWSSLQFAASRYHSWGVKAIPHSKNHGTPQWANPLLEGTSSQVPLYHGIHKQKQGGGTVSNSKSRMKIPDPRAVRRHTILYPHLPIEYHSYIHKLWTLLSGTSLWDGILLLCRIWTFHHN